MGKGLLLAGLAAVLTVTGCSRGARAPDDGSLRLMVDLPPLSLNPRRAADVTGQRLGALIYRALTRIDADQVPQPDLASDWRILDGGRTWWFAIRPDARDHGGMPIGATQIAQCLESYRIGKPTPLARPSFPGWIGTESRGESVVLRFDQPSPYLARNLSLLRYFRSEGQSQPCAEPDPSARVIGSGPYRPETWNPTPEERINLVPVEPQAQGRKPLTVLFVGDDNARALKILRGEVDVTQNTFSYTKERWLEKDYRDRFDVLEREGTRVTYLAFNLNDPLLRRLEVRQAIAAAIDRDAIVAHKLLGTAKVAGSLLSPRLSESVQIPHAFDRGLSERLLDQAGLPRKGRGGIRFELRYRASPRREAIDTALMIQEMLSRVGIRLVLDVVESAVFTASIKKGAFQLYASSWTGVSDGSILYRTLRSGHPDNRVHYANPEMDKLLDEASAEADETRRIAVVRRVQTLMALDLPYLPLWFWHNHAIVRKGLTGLTAAQVSVSGSYEPLTWLR